MASVAAFLNQDPAPRGAPARGQVEERVSPGQALDGLQAIFQGRTDPFEVAFIQGFASDALGFRVPTPQEIEIQERQSALLGQRLDREERSNRVFATVGFLLDNRNKPISELFPGTSSPAKLEEAFGVRLDQDVIDRPDDLIAVTQKIAELTNNPSVALSHIDLLASDITRGAATQTPEERGADRAAREAQANSNLATNANAARSFASGDSELSKLFEQNVERLEGASGLDLDSSIDFSGAGGIFGDDLDNPDAARLLVAEAIRFSEGLEGQGRERGGVLRSILQTERFQDVVKRLNGLPAEDGVLSIAGLGEDDASASAQYLNLIAEGARASGEDFASFAQSIGLRATGLDDATAAFLFRQQRGFQEAASGR